MACHVSVPAVAMPVAAAAFRNVASTADQPAATSVASGSSGAAAVTAAAAAAIDLVK